jgi:hypothetical protein
VVDALVVDTARQEYQTQFGVGLFQSGAYGSTVRGFNSRFARYAPVVGVEWPNTLAHEIGHTYLGGVEEVNQNPQLGGVPLPAGLIYRPSYGKLFYIAANSNWINFMGDPYAEGVNAWVAANTYNQILHARESGQASRPNHKAQASYTQAAEQTLVLIGGPDANGQFVLKPPFIRPGAPSQAPQQGSYTAELYSMDDHLIDAKTFTLEASQPEGMDRPSQPSFYLELAYAQDAGLLIISNGRQEIYRLARSTNAPNLKVAQPGGGQPVSGPVTATWQASDADGEALSYTVLYSADGATWRPVALFWSQASLELDGAYLPGGQQAQLRVIASDGLNFVVEDSPEFSVPKHTPQVTILPSDPQAEPWQAGSPHLLAAAASDIEDGALPTTAYTWESDRDGLLGQGSYLWAGLSAGNHTVTVTVTDADGQAGHATTTIIVATAPTASPTRPPAAAATATPMPPGGVPLTGLWSPLWIIYALGCLGAVAGLAILGWGGWLMLTPADRALARLQKEGRAWQRRYQAGQVAQTDAPQILAQLRTHDRRGRAWSYNPFSQQWLLWDGLAWQPTRPPTSRAGRIILGLVMELVGLGIIVGTAAAMWIFG